MAVSALPIATTNPTALQISTAPKFTLSCSLSFHSKPNSCKPNKLSSSASIPAARKTLLDIGIGLVAASVLALTPLDADATRIEYYATVGEPICELNYAKSGLGYCDVVEGPGDEAPLGELINVHYTARFADETVFDSSYKRGRPLTMRIGVGKVIKGLDQGILGGEGVPPMRIGGKRKLRIPPHLAYGPEPAGCFSGSPKLYRQGSKRLEQLNRHFDECGSTCLAECPCGFQLPQVIVLPGHAIGHN